jgi:hypothetical protein
VVFLLILILEREVVESERIYAGSQLTGISWNKGRGPAKYDFFTRITCLQRGLGEQGNSPFWRWTTSLPFFPEIVLFGEGTYPFGIILFDGKHIPSWIPWNSPLWRGNIYLRKFPGIIFFGEVYNISLLEFPGIALLKGAHIPSWIPWRRSICLGEHIPFWIPWNSLFWRISLLEFLGIILFGEGMNFVNGITLFKEYEYPFLNSPEEAFLVGEHFSSF